MASVEERLAKLEARVEEHSQLFVTLRETLVAFEHRMDGRFDVIERRFDAVDRRFETLDTKFVWLIGLYVTSVLAFAIAVFSKS
jgi:hypothetical protein